MARLLTLGRSAEFGAVVSLEDFKWDCDWYWAGGYVGNRNCHYHLAYYFNVTGKNAFDAFKEDFGDSLTLTNDQLWRFCDLFKQFYAYKNAAECFHFGGHFTSKDRKDDEINPEMNKMVNDHIEKVIIREIRLLCREIKNNKKD